MDYGQLETALCETANLFRFEHLETCDSTNTLLLERAGLGASSGLTLVADRQTAGRGRRGRSWVSEPGHSLTFSLLWRFASRRHIEGLSLVAGLSTAKALEDLGFEGVGLKWPNDIWLYGRKLGGILIEVLFDGQGVQVVIGIGLNLRLNPGWQSRIDQAFTALEVAAVPPPREILLATILRHLAQDLECFEREGFPPLCEDWNHRNALYGLPVRISSEHGEQRGICGKAQTDGSLELRQPEGGHLRIDVGDVSLCLDRATDY